MYTIRQIGVFPRDLSIIYYYSLIKFILIKIQNRTRYDLRLKRQTYCGANFETSVNTGVAIIEDVNHHCWWRRLTPFVFTRRFTPFVQHRPRRGKHRMCSDIRFLSKLSCWKQDVCSSAHAQPFISMFWCCPSWVLGCIGELHLMRLFVCSFLLSRHANKRRAQWKGTLYL